MTVSCTSCFWALLCREQFRFVYLSGSVTQVKVDDHTIEELLLHRSLLDFIHPDEVELARNDFTKFMRDNTLAGSITRYMARVYFFISPVIKWGCTQQVVVV